VAKFGEFGIPVWNKDRTRVKHTLGAFKDADECVNWLAEQLQSDKLSAERHSTTLEDIKHFLENPTGTTTAANAAWVLCSADNLDSEPQNKGKTFADLFFSNQQQPGICHLELVLSPEHGCALVRKLEAASGSSVRTLAAALNEDVTALKINKHARDSNYSIALSSKKLAAIKRKIAKSQHANKPRTAVRKMRDAAKRKRKKTAAAAVVIEPLAPAVTAF
jgi:hypothetical protein